MKAYEAIQSPNNLSSYITITKSKQKQISFLTSKKKSFVNSTKKMKARSQQASLPFQSYQTVRMRSNYAKAFKHSFQKIQTKHIINEDDEPNLDF